MAGTLKHLPPDTSSRAANESLTPDQVQRYTEELLQALKGIGLESSRHDAKAAIDACPDVTPPTHSILSWSSLRVSGKTSSSSLNRKNGLKKLCVIMRKNTELSWRTLKKATMRRTWPET